MLRSRVGLLKFWMALTRRVIGSVTGHATRTIPIFSSNPLDLLFLWARFARHQLPSVGLVYRGTTFTYDL